MNHDQNNAAVYLGKCLLQRLVELGLLTEKEAAKILKRNADYYHSALSVP